MTEQKATSISAALLPQQIAFIESNAGSNFSEKLRNLLDGLVEDRGDIVRYDKAALAEGNYEPNYIRDGFWFHCVFLTRLDSKRRVACRAAAAALGNKHGKQARDVACHDRRPWAATGQLCLVVTTIAFL